MTINSNVQRDATPAKAQVAAVCWRKHRGEIQVLLITSRETKRWVVPKGWVMEDVTAAKAAGLEAWQEAGVTGHINEQSMGYFHYDKVMSPTRQVPCSVQVFDLQVERLAESFPERKQRSRKWFSVDDAMQKVCEPSLRAIFANLPATIG